MPEKCEHAAPCGFTLVRPGIWCAAVGGCRSLLRRRGRAGPVRGAFGVVVGQELAGSGVQRSAKAGDVEDRADVELVEQLLGAAAAWFLAVSSGFGDQVGGVAAWRVDEGVMVSLAA